MDVNQCARRLSSDRRAHDGAHFCWRGTFDEQTFLRHVHQLRDVCVCRVELSQGPTSTSQTLRCPNDPGILEDQKDTREQLEVTRAGGES